MGPDYRDPETPIEWRAARALCEVLIAVDAARGYGLITGGPHVDIDRCEAVIAEADARGITTTTADQTLAIHVLLWGPPQ